MEPLTFANESDDQNQITIAVDDGVWGECPNSVCVSVSDERDVGSYNDTFECSFWMTREEATQLRDWLNRYLETDRQPR